MASNRGGGPCSLGSLGIVLHCISYQVVYTNTVVHVVLSIQVLSYLTPSSVQRTMRANIETYYLQSMS